MVTIPSPYGVSFILIYFVWRYNLIYKNFRLLTEYHSFLWYLEITQETIEDEESFRLLTEYHSFLWWNYRNSWKNGKFWWFPSPYGVSFILIGNVRTREEIAKVFPSPYGVSFILINMLKGLVKVGLGFRLLTEYHSFLFIKYWSNGTIKVKSFRLLTEYHSFLFLHC